MDSTQTITFKRGERVAFHAPSDLKFVFSSARAGSILVNGVVDARRTFRGRKVFDVLVYRDGQTLRLTIPTEYAFAATPLPEAETDPMSTYSVTGYKGIKGHGDSDTFHATIRLNGKVVLEAMNDGWGGPNEYRGSAGRSAGDALETAAKAWFAHYGYPEIFGETADMWLDWYVHDRPLGVTAREYVERFRAQVKEVARG